MVSTKQGYKKPHGHRCSRMFVMTFSLSMILTYWGLLMIAGVTPAERLLKLYDEKWGKNIDHVFNEILY
jgi:hypothetical protein